MFFKFCSRCNTESYSAIIPEKWLCPNCGRDLTDRPLYEEDNDERIYKTSQGYTHKVEKGCEDGICPVR